MSLHRSISDLAASFAASVLRAIQSASLQDLHTLTGDAAPARRGPGRPRKDASVEGGGNGPKPRPVRKGGRRSAADIQTTLDAIVGALKKASDGMRSEQLQKVLGLSKKDVTRPLGLALAAKAVKKKGQRRGTTYFAV